MFPKSIVCLVYRRDRWRRCFCDLRLRCFRETALEIFNIIIRKQKVVQVIIFKKVLNGCLNIHTLETVDLHHNHKYIFSAESDHIHVYKHPTVKCLQATQHYYTFKVKKGANISLDV